MAMFLQVNSGNAMVTALRFLAWAVVAFLMTASTYYLRRGYQVRQMFQTLKKQGIPLMPHSAVFGHLEVIGKLLSDLPSDAHGDYMMVRIQENWQTLFPGSSQRPPIAYIDLWPFAAPMMITLDPQISAQATQDHSLPKAHQQKHILYPLTKNRDVSSMEGAEWKLWRRRLNPGFSVQNITSRIPDLLEEINDFVDVLTSHSGKDGAWGPVFQLESATTRLALDLILRFFLNQSLNEQKSSQLSPLSAALIDAISRSRFYVHLGNILYWANPYRHFKLWQDYNTMANSLKPFLQQRMIELTRNKEASNKTLIDLIVNSLTEEDGTTDVAPERLMSDLEFLKTAIGQIITFLFAGHDTTATTICWAFRVLAQYPEVLARMRAEHDEILGPDPQAAAAVLSANPQLLNSLTYTNAVLKESMRVHGNVGTVRRGEPGFFLTGPPGSGIDGMRLPTDGFIVWDGTFAIHRSPTVWPRVNEFLPERFLTMEEDDPLRPPKNAWRFFAMGPRACIGQNLAMAEIKLVLALTVRLFDIDCAWDEWDKQRNFKGKPPTVWDDRCYQVSMGDSPPHVKDGMPVHVRLRNA